MKGKILLMQLSSLVQEFYQCIQAVGACLRGCKGILVVMICGQSLKTS